MKRKIKEIISGYLYILPSFVLILIFSVIPIFMTIFFSFTKYNVIQPPKFIGLDNYKYMLKDTFIFASIKNTLIYTIIVVPLQTFLSLIIAQILADKFRNKFGQMIKSSMFVPVISSAVLVGTLWSFLLSTDSGMINAFLSVFGIPRVNWLGTTQTALTSIAMVSIWKNIGYFLIIYYAGIMDIPANLYEAADIDGANKIQCFRYITVPHLKPITFLVVTLGTIWSFQVFDIVYVMTGGGPGKSTITLVLTIYRAAFKQYNMGYASATATLLLAIIMIITMLQKLLFIEKKEVKS